MLKQVNKRIDDSLYKQIFIYLKREEKLKQVGKGNLAPIHKEETEKAPESFLKRTVQHLLGSTTSEPISTNKSTLELFEQEDIQGRLLILGEPGSGKTNELLLLARELLYQARDFSDKPTPVIFELSEWNNKKEFSDWICQQLVEKYKIPFFVSDHWIKEKQLILLLDGLDELRNDKLIQCVKKINNFIQSFSLKIVVCCRSQEYDAIQANSDSLHCLNGALELLALKNAQIEEYLLKLNRGPSWIAAQSQPRLKKLADSPLFLPILAVVGVEKDIRSKEELIDEYIHIQLHDSNNHEAYPPGKAPLPEQTHHYLSLIANQLDSNKTTEFLIENIQPSWLNTPHARRWYRMSVGLSIGLVFGLGFGLGFGLMFGLIFGLSVGLSAGLIGGLIFGLIFGLIGGLRDIKTSEKLNLSWEKFIREGLSVGLIGGLIFGLMGGLGVWLNLGLIGGLIGGLTFGLGSGLIFGLMGVIKPSQIDVQDKINSNQGIRDSFRNGLMFGLMFGLGSGLMFGLGSGLMFGLGSGLMFGLTRGLSRGLSMGLIFGLIFGLMGGLLAVFQHLSLRIVLHQSGVAPWNYARFLEHAENHRFIQRTGGRYRFVHDLIRKRFAATLKENLSQAKKAAPIGAAD